MKVTLTAELCYAKGKKTVMTLALVKVGPILLAGTIKPLAGRYTEAQVLSLLTTKPAAFRRTTVGDEALPALLAS